ncbi:hypothetical protein [Cupriavidus sp. SW-Y-13]|uniref:hypothetical protein n=1 Tax=Cupriavidus sp. SW-Y-13 TaxID=2653854 RepID=UPI001366675D|nr:hypothetical protein [Cupriavidus sp. SW-Y-13]MWL87142.1 hypothetical protein [Cupriavidus sp. SW-Y-13]
MRSDILLIIHYAEVEIRAIAKQYVSHCLVECIGPDATTLALGVWVKTMTDEERTMLSNNPALRDEFEGVFRSRGYPEESISGINFLFESQETVDRDFHGNWGFAMR